MEVRMIEIFLSASVPERGRGDFDESADPFLIQFAVRELITVCLGRRRIVWGGHPSITPMVHAVCEDFGAEAEAPVALYQSRFFEGEFPEANQFFNPILVNAVAGNKAASLLALRRSMLQRPVTAAVFIGGMEGVLDEFAMFRELHGPNATVLALGAPGGAARDLATRLYPGAGPDSPLDRVDFARLFQERLGIDPAAPRVLGPT
jgi:hypothetical protein